MKSKKEVETIYNTVFGEKRVPVIITCQNVVHPITKPVENKWSPWVLVNTTSYVLQRAISVTLNNALPTNDNRCTWAIQPMNDDDDDDEESP